MLPTAAQGRKVVWEAIDKKGRRVLDQAFPPEIRAGKSERDMSITLKCGSVVQVVGSDNYNSLVGSNPVGVVFSEYSLADPAAWDYIRPILVENGGWALFIYTPRGRNHGYRLWEVAQKSDNWYADKLTVDDTGILTAEQIQAERDEGMPEEMIQQEFYCSFDAALVGAYFGQHIRDAEQQNRITNVPYEPNVPVETAWDLGMGDATAIWFFQQVGKEIRFIDYYEASGEALDHYVGVLQGKSYVYAHEGHIVPHDAQVRELGTGKSRLEVLESLGLKCRTAPKLGLDNGINAARQMFGKCWFDETKCERGLDALRQYRKEWDDKKKIFRDKPTHDWTSHPADAFRYAAVAMRPVGDAEDFSDIFGGSASKGWMGN